MATTAQGTTKATEGNDGHGDNNDHRGNNCHNNNNCNINNNGYWAKTATRTKCYRGQQRP